MRGARHGRPYLPGRAQPEGASSGNGPVERRVCVERPADSGDGWDRYLKRRDYLMQALVGLRADAARTKDKRKALEGLDPVQRSGHTLALWMRSPLEPYDARAGAVPPEVSGAASSPTARPSRAKRRRARPGQGNSRSDKRPAMSSCHASESGARTLGELLWQRRSMRRIRDGYATRIRVLASRRSTIYTLIRGRCIEAEFDARYGRRHREARTQATFPTGAMKTISGTG